LSAGFQLAQINIGRLKAPVGAPEVSDFVDNLERINALAESQPGFVWRLVGAAGDATDIRPFDDTDILINMSVWESLESLAAFVYRTSHRDFMRRRGEWFEPLPVYMALWWVAAGHHPAPAEAIERLRTLERLGPTAEAFTFMNPLAAPDAMARPPAILEECA
jgi:hypothetical protein